MSENKKVIGTKKNDDQEAQLHNILGSRMWRITINI